MAVQVDEASEAYERAMRNIAPPGPGICETCWAFIDPSFPTCYRCGHQPACLDVVVPISYSEHQGQLHTALRNYKDGASTGIRRNAAVRLAAILWRFLREHEACVARAAGVEEFDLVTIVPSSDPDRDARSAFRKLTGWIRPIKPRLQRTLEPTGEVKGRDFASNRFRAVGDVAGKSVLLLDDTWTTGGHAQSASHALLGANASTVALVVIGRHFRPDYEPVQGSGESWADLLDGLPASFEWNNCAVHAS